MQEPKIGIIGGSGLGAALLDQSSGRRHDVDTPFGKPSDAIIETRWQDVGVLLLNRHGPGHLINPTRVPSRANIFALKQLGCTHILASGAVGSLREQYKPRDLVIPDQIIDKTVKRDCTFFENAAVHVEFAEPFCPVLRRILMECDPAMESRACYVCMEGPAFSTRAESLTHRLWGGDLIGMTAMPEAKLAREAEIPYALVAMVTDYDSWRPHSAQELADPFKLLKEIIANLEAATQKAILLIRRAVELMGQRREELGQCPALHALKLGIWSDRTQISETEKQRLAPLWMRYFE